MKFTGLFTISPKGQKIRPLDNRFFMDYNKSIHLTYIRSAMKGKTQELCLSESGRLVRGRGRRLPSSPRSCPVEVRLQRTHNGCVFMDMKNVCGPLCRCVFCRG